VEESNVKVGGLEKGTIDQREIETILKTHQRTVLEPKLIEYVKLNWFQGVKFVDNDLANLILGRLMKDEDLRLPEGVAETDFYDYNRGMIKKAVNSLRSAVQGSIRKHWIADMKKKSRRKEWVVPECFPGCLRIEETADPNAFVLHPKYRKKGGESEDDFYYLATRVLAAITPSLFRQNFNNRN